jgi:glycerol-3-phosphate dehydrogenase
LQLANLPAQEWRQVTKSVHLVVCRDRLPGRAALTFNSPHDGRFLSLVPWGSHALIGAAETETEDDPEAVFATSTEVAYLLEATQQAFPSASLSEKDVVSTNAGLRPLNGHQRDTQPQRRSRQYHSEEVKPGLLAVTGGELALYRSLAWEVVNQVTRMLAQDHARYPIWPPGVAQPPLSGKNLEDWDNYRSHWQAALAVGSPLADDIARHLVATYGSELPAVLRLLTEEPGLAQRLTSGLPVIKAQIIHAIRHEMALTLSDVMDRRTHLQTQAADQGLSAVEAVAHLMAAELGWTPQEKARQIATYRQQLRATCSWRERIAV